MYLSVDILMTEAKALTLFVSIEDKMVVNINDVSFVSVTHDRVEEKEEKYGQGHDEALAMAGEYHSSG
jgi:hypothetical protein